LFFPAHAEVPETALHLRLRTALFLILERALSDRAFVGSDQFLYWDPTDPKACLAPDVFVRLGRPLGLLPSYKTWEHGAPQIAVEIVSPIDARDRNLTKKLERYQRTGIPELVRYDPLDSDLPLRLWDFTNGAMVERDLATPNALYCEALGAYWTLTPDPVLGKVLRLAANADGSELWPTTEELAERRIAELEAELRRVKSQP
jgi:Uma2 family endonuclease